jgi:hypothetical protein
MQEIYAGLRITCTSDTAGKRRRGSGEGERPGHGGTGGPNGE